MDEGLAAVIAAAVAGGIGIGGTLLGIVVGRSQTTGQAHVEHGQWLRGQRQEAYLALLAGWDAIVDRLRNNQTDWDRIVDAWRQHGRGLRHPSEDLEELLTDSWKEIRQLAERIDLLGPQGIDYAMRGLEEAFIGMRDEIRAQIDRQPPRLDPEA